MLTPIALGRHDTSRKARKALPTSSFPTRLCRPLKPARSKRPLPELVISLVGFHLLQDAVKVVGLRCLQRWELLERIEFLHPQHLADGQHVPVVQVGCSWGGQVRRPSDMADFESEKLTVCSKGSRLMFPTSVQ